MLIQSDLKIIHEDFPMPVESSFCKSLWAEDYDADGDYYYEGIDGQWTNLELTKKEDVKETSLEINVWRKDRKYESLIIEVEELGRYIDAIENGEYDFDDRLNNLKKPCVTHFYFETHNLNSYKEFLETVHEYLQQSKGILISNGLFDAVEFEEAYLS